MSIESPSGHDFKKLGKILFYVLILPALFYYIWQGLKALFGLLAAAFEFSEERKPLINNTSPNPPNVVEDNPMLLRVEIVQAANSHPTAATEYKVVDTFGDNDLTTKNVPEMKRIISDKIHVDPNTIKELEFFRKKIIPPMRFLTGDSEPADITTACYLKITASVETYYFKYIQGRTNPKDQKQIGTEDTFSEVKQKISLRVTGASDPKVRLLIYGKNMSDNLKDGEQFGSKMLELKPNTIYEMKMQNEWKTGYRKEEHEEFVMKITF